MFVWLWEPVGPPADVVARAQSLGLSFLVVRASDADDGFYLGAILNELLPLAHRAGIAVVAYDPPQLDPVEADVERARHIISFRDATGGGVDGFAADIEVRPDGLEDSVARYGQSLRTMAGPSFPLVAIVYPPQQFPWFPFHALVPAFDVLMPMAYWRGVTTDAAGFVAEAVDLLAPLGKPVSVLGQAFAFGEEQIDELADEPSRPELEAAVATARAKGAIGYSNWVWHTSSDDAWSVLGSVDWPPLTRTAFRISLLPRNFPPAG
jgi:hypothetical protein